MAEQAPDTWVGEEVTVRYGPEDNHRTSGTLEALNERGALLRSPGRNEGEAELFYPWASIVSIRRGETAPAKANTLRLR